MKSLKTNVNIWKKQFQYCQIKPVLQCVHYQDIFKLLTFSLISAFFGVQFGVFLHIDLRCLLDIKVLIQQANV